MLPDRSEYPELTSREDFRERKKLAALAFSDRLKQALKEAGSLSLKPRVVQKAFNAQFSGRPVGTYAVRKWLRGESIPTQEKIRALAQWLGVSANWLRFGAEPAAATAAVKPCEQDMVRNYLSLPSEYQELARRMILILLEKSRRRTGEERNSRL